MIEESPGPL